MLIGNFALLGLASIILPFIGALIIMVTPRSTSRIWGALFSALSLVATLLVAGGFYSHGMVEHTVAVSSFGSITIVGFVFDRLSTLLAPAFVGIGFLVLVYAGAYLTNQNREHADSGNRRFYAILLSFVGAMAGLAYSSTLIGQLIFFEITGACSFGLIGYYMSDTAQHSAMKALIITHIASLGLFLASGALFSQTGSFDVNAIAQTTDGYKSFILLAILFAAWGKSAQLPMYMWLPSAMEAPTPVSAYLHGGSMVKVGVYVFARAVLCAGEIPHLVGWIALVGAIITLIASFLMYLPQTDMKRLLAYSTISQLSYIFLALAFACFGSSMAFKGGVAHIFNHAFAKTLFFLVAGALSYTCGTRILTKIRGLGKAMPLAAIAFICAAFAVAGVPPFSGFFSKFMIVSGGFDVATSNWIMMLIILLALLETIGCFAWFLKWIGACIPGEASPEVAQAQPLPRAMALVFVVLTIMTVCSSFIAAWWLG